VATLVVSYSRDDRAQVRAVVALLRAAFRGVDNAVFWDEDFEPGDPWFEQISHHIDATPQLFVFWCEHAANSQQVRREFSYALSRGKRVVPVLMDDTALVPELAPIHGIDLRDALQHPESSGSASPVSDEFLPRPAPPLRVPARPPATGRLTAIAGFAVLVIAVVAGALLWSVRSASNSPPSSVDLPSEGPPPPPPAPNETPPEPPVQATERVQYDLLAIVAVVGAMIVVLAATVIVMRRTRQARAAPQVRAGGPAIPPWNRDRIVAAFQPFVPDE
jgi:hypothetical protein